MKFEIEITSATIVLGPGTDTCILHTKLPPACWPFDYNETLTIKAAHRTGEDYINKCFPGLPIEMIPRISK